MTKWEKKKARNKRKRAEAKAVEKKRWETCCKGSLEEWDCFCSWGCDQCKYHYRCTKCGRLYKSNE